MFVPVPEDWKQVGLPEFEEFLKTCPDYVRDGFGFYCFRWNTERFAYVDFEAMEVFADPALLRPG
jgi:hypothetical protein